LNISSEEEKQLIEKLNSSVVLDGGYIVVVIGALLFYIMYKLKGRHLLKSPSIYLFSGGSFLLFISFQIYFFFVNQNYTYPTLEETFFEIKKELLANLNN